MSDRISLCKPSFGREESLALQETLESGWWGRGPRAIEFEERFAQYVGAEHAVALNSATAALHLALLVAEVGGQEVLTTSMTFVSTNHAILQAGGRPVFCDIEAETMNISADEIRRKVTPTTRAVVGMHYGGRPEGGYVSVHGHHFLNVFYNRRLCFSARTFFSERNI